MFGDNWSDVFFSATASVVALFNFRKEPRRTKHFPKKRKILYNIRIIIGQALLIFIDMRILPEEPSFIIWFGTIIGAFGIFALIITIRFYIELKKEIDSEIEMRWFCIETEFNRLMTIEYYQSASIDELFTTLILKDNTTALFK